MTREEMESLVKLSEEKIARLKQVEVDFDAKYPDFVMSEEDQRLVSKVVLMFKTQGVSNEDILTVLGAIIDIVPTISIKFDN
jgi:hypothetical protein